MQCRPSVGMGYKIDGGLTSVLEVKMAQEHHNHITYWRFREGICQTLGLDERASEEEKNALIKIIEEKWWFCGGKDTRIELDRNDDEGEASTVPERVLQQWAWLWNHYFPSTPMPEAEEACVCDKGGLRYNVYITDGEQVIVIGRICLRQFLPLQANKMDSKHCERCIKPHQNRKDNYCNACRILNKKEEEERVQAEYERTLRNQQEHRAMVAREREEEHRRLVEEKQQEEERQARVCECGAEKAPYFPQCYYCHQRKLREQQERLKQMTPQQRKVFFCSCGKGKKPGFTTCWSCRGH